MGRNFRERINPSGMPLRTYTLVKDDAPLLCRTCIFILPEAGSQKQANEKQRLIHSKRDL